jgi:hypothetical protein
MQNAKEYFEHGKYAKKHADLFFNNMLEKCKKNAKNANKMQNMQNNIGVSQGFFKSICRKCTKLCNECKLWD